MRKTIPEPRTVQLIPYGINNPKTKGNPIIVYSINTHKSQTTRNRFHYHQDTAIATALHFEEGDFEEGEELFLSSSFFLIIMILLLLMRSSSSLPPSIGPYTTNRSRIVITATTMAAALRKRGKDRQTV